MTTSSKSNAAKSAPKSAPKPATRRSARKPARATKVAAPTPAASPQSPAATDAHQRWRSIAMQVPGEDSPLTVPYDVFLNEARAAAGFVRKRWNPSGATPGLSRVSGRLPASTPDEILELVEAVQVAHTAATLTVSPEAPADKARAAALIAELSDALDFSLDAPDVPRDDVERLARVRSFHKDHGVNPAALGQDLRNHATLADALRARLTADDQGFDAGLIDEALALAPRLLRPSLAPAAQTEDGAAVTDEGAYAQRNRLLRLLVERVGLVRRCARRVFKDFPDVMQEATSAYERDRRARARKARAEAEAAKGGADGGGTEGDAGEPTDDDA